MLEGVTVIDMTSVVIGPLCTQILADHGATVIKVEGRGGDIGRRIGGLGRTPGMGPKFLHLNRNKRSICLDLKSSLGHAALMRLLKNADVLTWNIRPSSMTRLGLDYEQVCKINPRIVYCGMFGFGTAGRYAELPVYDPVIQSMSGVAALHERAFGEPRYVPYVLADRTVGLIAVQMIAMALFNRERRGVGQSIEVPMFENMVSQVLTEHLYDRTYQSKPGVLGDPRLLNRFYAPTPTADGYITIAANTDDQVFSMFEIAGHPELREDERFGSVSARFTHVEEFNRLKEELIRSKTTAEWLTLCKDNDIPAAPYHTLESLVDDPHLKDVGLMQTKMHPTEGPIIDLKPANSLSDGDRSDWLPAPRLGEHTLAILTEAGFTQGEIADMLTQGAAYQARDSEEQRSALVPRYETSASDSR